jgi:type IV secretory pathway TraG/TraD family ATPase VirD4
METKPADDVSFFARTDFRAETSSPNYRARAFGIKQRDKLAHVYIVGKTGTGKSTLLQAMAQQDIAAGRGLALLDPHGDLVENIVARIPEHRQNDLIYFNVPDSANPLAFNPLEKVAREKRPLTASGLIDAFKKIWDDTWGPRMEHILRNAILALLDQPEATLADVLRLLDDKEFREQAMVNVENEQVREFWLREFKQYTPGLRAQAIAPIQNKVGAFLTNPLLNRILVQPRSSFDLRQVIDEGKILLVNLAKGRIGEDTAALMGALLVSRIGLAGLSRADVPENERRDFTLYLDEFQTFTTLSLANMLSELRKYHVGMVMAHQYMSQLDHEIRDAILGNAGTIIAFRVGPSDAIVLAKEFDPVFGVTDLLNLPNYRIYLKLMIEGHISKPFSGVLLPPD